MIELYGEQKGKHPITERTSKKVFTLPSWPYQSAQDIEYIVKTINNFYSNRSSFSYTFSTARALF